MAPKPQPKPNPKPSKPIPRPTPTPTRQEEDEPICEFTHPCTTSTTPSPSDNANTNASGGSSGGVRKLISHIFGRNKTSTKLFPSHVWVHYCRKHYQRARYRARAWPFTQCELLLDSLDRMEGWGGVESFELCLRRREIQRIESLKKKKQATAKGEGVGVGVGVRKGLRRGTSTSTSASASACASRDGDVDDDEEYGDGEEASSDDGDGDGAGAGKRRRRRPRIKTCPVPEWLRAETGPGKSFDEIRAIVKRIREDLTEQHQRCQAQGQKTKGKKEQVLFPDIEILPTFRPWVLEQAN